MKTKTLPTPPLIRHQHCQVEVRPSTNARHYAQYYCLDCQKFIAWISLRDLEVLKNNP